MAQIAEVVYQLHRQGRMCCSVRPEESLPPKTPDNQAEIFLRGSDRFKNVELRKILMFAMKGSDGLGEIRGRNTSLSFRGL
jgi:hypothetical protein